MKNKVIIIGECLPKKETLEEASREYWKRGQFGLEKPADTERAFLRGGLWQKEQENLRLEHAEILLNHCEKCLDERIKESNKLYTEEEVIAILEYTRENFYDTGSKWHSEPDTDLTSEQLVEKFKKKK
jgi:hypothetical protein